MKIAFWGSDSFALPVLEEIIKKHELALIVCQPDQRAGRNRKLAAPVTKTWALKRGIEVLQPDRLKGNQEFVDELKKSGWDLFLVISYGKIIPKDILDIPAYGSINLHASLLPKLRGASPIQSAILNGFEESGITAQFMSSKMDAGDIISQERLRIPLEWDFGKLREELSILSVKFLSDVLESIQDNNFQRTVQSEEDATYCYKIETSDTIIDWSRDANTINNQVRAFSPKMGARTQYKGKMVKIWEALNWPNFEDFILDKGLDSSGLKNIKEARPGEILVASKGKLLVATGRSYLEIVKLQPENRKLMVAADFINGFRPEINLFFGYAGEQ